MIDLTEAVIVAPAGLSPRELSHIRVLQEEVGRLANVDWKVQRDWPVEEPGKRPPVIAIGPRSSVKAWSGPLASLLSKDDQAAPAEGFRILTDAKEQAVAVAGNDERGILFGIGRLIRELRVANSRVLVPEGWQLTTAPKAAIRGHQLGYRAKTNSYDAWDAHQWDRYIRDLALFGTNAIELLPPRTDDDADSPHFPLPPLQMMVEMSKTIDKYGLDVWVWFPAMDADYTNPDKVDLALKEWDEIFRKLPRLDAVFVPGGDPGHTEPKILLAFLEKATGVLHKSHPKAQMWVSPQGFNSAWMAQFLDVLKAEPDWLTGVVFGPQVRTTLPELRKAIPTRYPIRGYPDITHNRQCQHPVPDWDLAYAVTEGREAINPRPVAQAQLVKAYLKNTVGFISYSEGCNDDVNKFVWSAVGWDPDADVVEILRQYARVFIDQKTADSFAQALLALERNWSGPLLTNASVETTLRQFQDLERDAAPSLRLNWRFQQALYRAYYDAYLRDRLTHESALEARALEALRQAPTIGTDLAIRKASELLGRALTDPVSLDRRARVFELGEALFQSIRMQLSVARYQAIAAERGANLDTIDTPLNNRLWLEEQFADVRRLPNEKKRLQALNTLLNRTDPGPGGFYDDLGDPANSPHLVRTPSPEDDPLFDRAAFQGFDLNAEWPTAWRQYAQAFYDAPLHVRYEGLDPNATYRVRVSYAGDNLSAQMRLEADGTEVHPFLKKPDPVRSLEFDIPPQATADGRLQLTWTTEPGRGGNGRACQVAEVWLTRVNHVTHHLHH